nr:hypothetical protein [Tanacetum cinerariifolium]
MVNYKWLLEKHWLQKQPVQQWYQSRRSNSWDKPIQNRMQKVFEKGYLRRESVANTLPRSSQRKLLSRESKELLRRKVKEIKVYNASNVRAAIKEKKMGKATTRKERRARCYICKKRGHDVAMIHGLPEEHDEDLKECYKRTIDLVKCYYKTTLRAWYKEGLVKYEETKEVEIGCDYAKEGNPQEHVGSSRSGLRIIKDNTRERFKNVQGGETHFGVILEGDNETDGDQVTGQNDGGNTSENDDFAVIT